MQRTITISANGQYIEPTPGRFFAVHAATAAFDVEVLGEGRRTLSTGSKFGNPGGRRFSRVHFFERNGAAVTIRFEIAEEEIFTVSQVEATAKDPSTYTKGSPAAAGATTSFAGLDGVHQRKQIVVNNTEKTVADGGTGQYIEAGDDTNTAGSRVQLAPGQMFTLVTNGVVKVAVPGGCAPAVVLETFYSA